MKTFAFLILGLTLSFIFPANEARADISAPGSYGEDKNPLVELIIKDSNGDPVVGATVEVLVAKKIIKGKTNNKGQFNKFGNYITIIDYVKITKDGVTKTFMDVNPLRTTIIFDADDDGPIGFNSDDAVPGYEDLP